MTSLLFVHNLRATRASSNFDIGHMRNVGYVYDLPFLRARGFAKKILEGWQLSDITSWQTGTSFNATNYPDNAGVANEVGTSSYPDLFGNPSANIPSVPLSGFGPLPYNPGVFVAPRGLTFGDAGRNSPPNPSWSNWNVALFKHFAIKENMEIELRGEAFNVFNHTKWAPLGGE
jgi:hypothetical protein